MIVSHRHRFIFIKTFKTAGTSVEIALSQHCGERDIITPISPDDESARAHVGGRGPQHHTPPKGPAAWWAVVSRHPGRGTHFYNHMPAAEIRRAVRSRTWNDYVKVTIVRNPFDKALSYYWHRTKRQQERPDVDEFLIDAPEDKLSDWDAYAIDDQIVVDRIVRYERLDADLADLGDHLGIDVVLPARRAKGTSRLDRRHYSEVIGPDARRRIEAVCRREIAAFGYRWDDDPVGTP